VYLMRFDLRAPGRTAAERSALYRAALDMSAWADEQQCTSIVVSEHHAADDGYLSTPFTLAAAIAAVTSKTPIVVAAALLPLYDTVRLAEELITLDHLSQGRTLVVLGLGYRPSEYQLFGVDYHQRGRIADEKLPRLLELLREADAGMAIPRITPAPFTSPMPMLAWGGRSIAAARRAGRHGIGLFAQADLPGLEDAYRDASLEAGHEPGLCILPTAGAPLIVFVHDDVDTGWQEVGPSMLADATSYWEWNEAAGTTEGTASLSRGSTVDALRAEAGAHQVMTTDQATALVRTHGPLGLHPLCGGLDPEVAWPYLRRAVAAANAPAS
jgi:alkanesulfonate monooxygenase SsuD/methylene tetrahydromethanopterin reductase-like flavin-dependent oxidoreductase (luciferase family)